MKRGFFLVQMLLGLLLFNFLSLRVHGASPAEDLSEAIARNRSKVEEFRIIQEVAKELNLRVWLVGGTAAGYAHYVKANLNNPKADYDFLSIYTSNENTALVVDGLAEDAEKFEAKLKERMNYLRGSKESFQVELLQTPRTSAEIQNKLLLDESTLANRNADSHSLGLIELTANTDPVIRDLRHWESKPKTPALVNDILNGEISFYRRPKHNAPQSIRLDSEPEILSVLRALTHSFRNNIPLSKQAMRNIQEIASEFNPKSEMTESNRKRLNELGLNMIQNASDLEEAFEVLDQLGLRQKLIQVSNSSGRENMGWWLSKVPLATRPLGKGRGRTVKQIASELGISVEQFTLSHETDSLLSYELMSRGLKGPNAYMSRDTKNQQAERAVSGPGFYLLPGRVGGRGTGYTLRYRPHPEAKEGEDFRIVGSDFIVMNAAVLKIVPEKMDMTLSEFFEEIKNNDFDRSDRGQVEMLKRRIERDLQRNNKLKEAQETYESIKKDIQADGLSDAAKTRLLKEWFSIPFLVKIVEPSWINDLISSGKYDSFFVQHVLSKPIVKDHPDWVNTLLEKGNVDYEIIRHVLSKPFLEVRPEWVLKLLSKAEADPDPSRKTLIHGAIAEYILPKPEMEKAHDIVLRLVRERRADLALNVSVLSKPQFKQNPEFLALIEGSGIPGPVTLNALRLALWIQAHPDWMNNPSAVEELMRESGSRHGPFSADKTRRALKGEKPTTIGYCSYLLSKLLPFDLTR